VTDTGDFTRRRLLGGAVAGGAGLVAATRLLEGAEAVAAESSSPGDPQLVSDLMGVELLSQVVIEHVLLSPHMSLRSRRVAHRVLAAERAHAAALEPHLRRLRSPRPRVPGTTEEIDAVLAARHVSHRVSELHSEHDCLELLLNLESIAEGAYYSSLSKLSNPRLQLLAARILASEAQHEAMVGVLRDHKDFARAAPYAFVEGIAP
jgi:Ferritin-like domain